jgi:pimeloyl-ACP methyl ester carboxylesterase
MAGAGPQGQTTSRNISAAACRQAFVARLSCILIACLLAITSAGCVSVTARDTRVRNALADGWERLEVARGLDLSLDSGAVLARQQLLIEAQEDPARAARLLETRLQTQSEPNGALALAELSYHVGVNTQTKAPVGAISWYRDAAVIAAIALGNPAMSHPELAMEIHNRAVARLIRLAQTRRVRTAEDQNWHAVLEAQNLAVHSSTRYLAAERIGDLRVANDLLVEGMDHVYRSSGLGVPLVAHRFTGEFGPPDVQDQFFPREQRIAVTAVARPGGGLENGDWRRYPPTIELLDPFQTQSVTVGARSTKLGSDRTTPLAIQVARSQLAALEWTGLFDSNFERPGLESGLYMLRPYEQGRIPVVFVHGLASSPRAWVQTINELQNDPSIAARYQFWMFLYPTGQPIPGSADRLRRSLIKVRESFDPNHADIALDRMVLVGHSMGGLLSKMMVQDSKLVLWDAMITIPRDQFKASPQVQQSLDSVLIFRPLPFVARVVFIATPHRGSPIANSGFGQTIAALVRRPAYVAAHIAEIEAMNGPDVISPELRGRAINAIENLRTDSPILGALKDIPIQPGVAYHSIIPLIDGSIGTDGVVEYRSSHLDGAASERIFAGTHLSQQDPSATAELERILREHLALYSTTAVAARRN